jgi:hypothetical protein
MTRLAGVDFDIRMGDFAIPINKTNISIEDGGEVSLSGGTPNGYTSGEMKASGEMVLSPEGLSILTEAAKSAGSWEELPPYDMLFYGKAIGNDGEEMKVEAFDCKFRLADLLDVDRNSNTKPETKLKFDVTGRDFVFINDVPVLSKARRERL